MTNWDYIISKKYKDQVYKMIHEKRMVLHGGVIGDYDENNYVVTLLPDWVPYQKEYGITEFEHQDNRGRQIIDEKNKKVYLNGKLMCDYSSTEEENLK